MYNKSLGIIETNGFSGSLMLANEINKEKGLQIVGSRILNEEISVLLIEGELGALRKAVKAGADVLLKAGCFRNAHIIAMPHHALLSTLNFQEGLR